MGCLVSAVATATGTGRNVAGESGMVAEGLEAEGLSTGKPRLPEALFD